MLIKNKKEKIDLLVKKIEEILYSKFIENNKKIKEIKKLTQETLSLAGKIQKILNAEPTKNSAKIKEVENLIAETFTLAPLAEKVEELLNSQSINKGGKIKEIKNLIKETLISATLLEEINKVVDSENTSSDEKIKESKELIVKNFTLPILEKEIKEILDPEAKTSRKKVKKIKQLIAERVTITEGPVNEIVVAIAAALSQEEQKEKKDGNMKTEDIREAYEYLFTAFVYCFLNKAEYLSIRKKLDSETTKNIFTQCFNTAQNKPPANIIKAKNFAIEPKRNIVNLQSTIPQETNTSAALKQKDNKDKQRDKNNKNFRLDYVMKFGIFLPNSIKHPKDVRNKFGI